MVRMQFPSSFSTMETGKIISAKNRFSPFLPPHPLPNSLRFFSFSGITQPIATLLRTTNIFCPINPIFFCSKRFFAPRTNQNIPPVVLSFIPRQVSFSKTPSMAFSFATIAEFFIPFFSSDFPAKQFLGFRHHLCSYLFLPLVVSQSLNQCLFICLFSFGFVDIPLDFLAPFNAGLQGGVIHYHRNRSPALGLKGRDAVYLSEMGGIRPQPTLFIPFHYFRLR